LPKYKSRDNEGYINGMSSTGKPSGAIERYKYLIHGEPTLRHNGVIAFVENKSIEQWLIDINNKLKKTYPHDSLLTSEAGANEYTSTHIYHESDSKFNMYHFWINLTSS